jgi:hypothetical protein
MVKIAKYMVEIVNETDLSKKYKLYKKKSEIIEKFGIPEYMVTKMILINSNFNYRKNVMKRDVHAIYKDLVMNVRIYLLRPKVKF